MITIMKSKSESVGETVGRSVRIRRPWRKKLGSVAIVAMKRNPGNGHIVNQEWWDLDEFGELVFAAQEEGSARMTLEAYPADDVPRWIRWILGKPQGYAFRASNPFSTVNNVRKAIRERLREDRN